MKNIMSSLIVVFSLFATQLAYATYAGKSCNDPSLPVTLSQLDYVGAPLTDLLKNANACTVIDADNDNTANKKCNLAALNPGNPQYLKGDNTNGSKINNKLKYYFCLNMGKREFCNARDQALSSTMEIKWQQDPGTTNHNQGDCLCGRKGTSESKLVVCPADPSVLQADNSTGCPTPGADNVNGVCRCKIDNSVVKTATDKCPDEAPKQVTENVNDADFDECLADIKEAKRSCSEDGQKAIAQCSKDAPTTNKNVQEAQRVMSIGLDALIAKNAGTGALDACAKMGAAGTAVIEGLSLLKENCKKELSACKKGCEDVKAFSSKSTEDMVKECKAKFQQATPPKLWDDAHEKRYTELAATYKDAGASAEKFCKGDVQIADNNLDGMLQDLAGRVQAADICKCQLTAGSTNSGATVNDKCESVMTPLTCMQNLNQPGCSFSSVGCSPGSTIAGCRNPVSQINPSGSGVGMPASGFAGPGFGSSGGGGTAGKVNVGDGDFSGLYDDARPTGSGTAAVDNGSPFAAAGGAGGSGGGGSFGGPEGAGGKEGEGEKSGLSGFFNNAKAAAMSMFGNGGGDKGGTMKKPDMKSFKGDVNGYRPKGAVRGMANAGEVGGKNRDIWKTMNERYNDQYHTFITVESPSK